LGLSSVAYMTNDNIIFHLGGLQENLEEGIQLLVNSIRNLFADENIYDSFKVSFLKNREDEKNNQFRIRSRLYQYSVYEEDAPVRNVLSNDEIEQFNAP